MIELKFYAPRNAVITILTFFVMVVSSLKVEAQDSTAVGYSAGTLLLKNPQSIISKYKYDPKTDRYIYTESVGDFNISYPRILTPKQYQDLVLKESMKAYFKEKLDAVSGKKAGSEEAQKNLLPDFYIKSGLFQSIFGGDVISVVPQGSVSMDLGLRFQKNDNPSLSPRNRRNISFDFQQRIELSLLGKVGERLQIAANYNTETTFDFQNLIKLEYTPTEDDIIRKIEVGNVAMPLNSSLITGAQSLFGVKTELQFGKTTVTGVFSEQRSQTRTVVAQGNGTLEDVKLFALDYEEDRHFFLSQYFRDVYDEAAKTYPYPNTQVQVTRIEVWVTNRGQRTDNVRNLVALQDIGESDLAKIGVDNNANFINAGVLPGAFPDNSNNKFDPSTIGNPATSDLTEAIRDIASVQSGFGGRAVNEGFDYAILENARKLQPNEYRLNAQLGYISLNQRLSNDEVLGVAYQYTVGGQVFQVGEFANDGVDATTVGTLPNSNIEVINNNNLVVKMLKSSLTNVNEPIWDLMMKNIYSTGAFQLSPEDFRLNILYANPSPINFIEVSEGASGGFPNAQEKAEIEETILINLFGLDRLNIYNDPQSGGDGFFDFVDGYTVDTRNGSIIFPSVEPFGESLFNKLSTSRTGTPAEDYDLATTYNPNQARYVYREMYESTKADALDVASKNVFQIKIRYKSTGGDGISVGAFNLPPGSVKVTAGGRVLQEGIDYTVNYQAGRVQLLDESLKASNTPIEISTENNSLFRQQNKRFAGIDIEHKFNDNFLIGGTFLNLNERPLTQKANYGVEPVSNTILGARLNFSTEAPFLTRLANKLPNIDTDAKSNFSIRAEAAYLFPNAPKTADFNGEATVYVDDFEGAQSTIDIKSPLAWSLSSTPLGVQGGDIQTGDPNILENGYNRAKLAWYTIDPIFYNNQRPGDISDDDVSLNETRRVFVNEIFPRTDLAQGQTTVQFTLDLAYYPDERGPYNNNPGFDAEPNSDKWAGITRSITATNFEQSNVEYIQFWILDPFNQPGNTNTGGELVFNLGNISEDVLKDGRKQYENGLPEAGATNNLEVRPTPWGQVPANQSLVYAFDAVDANRNVQDVGLDGLNDTEEAQSPFYTNGPADDPASDNYQYFLDATGSILDRYKKYNGLDGNSPIDVSDTNRGAITLPDVEDVNRDLTMNTIDSYFEYTIPIVPNMSAVNNRFITDEKEREITLPNGRTLTARWLQFKIPINPSNYDETDPNTILSRVGGITDLRSIRFIRMYMKEFEDPTVLRFGTLDLIRGDWRRYTQSLEENLDPEEGDGTEVDVLSVNIEENSDRVPIPYVLPPGVQRERLNNTNNIIRQNEQSLALTVCGDNGLNNNDSRAVFKNIDIDMRQYERLRMFLHAEAIQGRPVPNANTLVAFIRFGTDFTNNYYQVEIPLQLTQFGATSESEIWPADNEILLPLDLLSQIKSQGISDGTLGNPNAVFYNENGDVVNEFDPRQAGELRVAIKGNPTVGSVRALMVGVKNTDAKGICAEVWFNELRLSGLDSQGGWAAIGQIDTNLADFASVSATGRMSTIGFGTIEQGPRERNLEDSRQYDVTTNLNVGQLLPKKWGVQIPFNYNISEEIITPQYDPFYEDLKLKDRLDTAASQDEEDAILNRAEDYTKRTSINFIGVRKNRAPEQKERIYDIENFDFSYSYNETFHRDYEIEQRTDQNVRLGMNYGYAFKPLNIEPFKKLDSLKGKYWDWLKEINFNPLPTSIAVTSNLTRAFSDQRFREVDFSGDVNPNNIPLPSIQQRNFLFDWAYSLNYNLSRSLQVNFTASNNNIIRNYFDEDGEVLRDNNIWSGFWDIGEPNRHSQRLEANYELPLKKIPIFSFIDSNYAYTGDFDWQREGLAVEEVVGERINTIQNANTHRLNTTFNMDRLYQYLGLVKKKASNTGTRSGATRGTRNPKNNPLASNPTVNNQKKKTGLSAGNKFTNTIVGLLTAVKRLGVDYSETNSKTLPGYTQSIGFIGTLRPSVGFVFGSQSDVRFEAAKQGWLTTFPEFNQQFLETRRRTLAFTGNIQLLPDLTIDLTANRLYNENIAENFRVDVNGDNELFYNKLLENRFGNFEISNFMLKTAFKTSDQDFSEVFQTFRDNRLVVAQRLAAERGLNPNDVDGDGFPVGLGKTNQSVLIPAFVSAYTGQDAEKVSLGVFRDIPIPNWQLKYTGFMKIPWFKKKFRRFSIQHGYRSSYTINNFTTNLEYDPANNQAFDQAGNFLNPVLYSNVNLVEQFNPLVRVDFELKSSLKILAEVKRDRALSLSLDNQLLTEATGQEYVFGLGYRVANVPFTMTLGGRRQTFKGDLNFKADVTLRDNITVIRSLDVENNQVTAGQKQWSLKFTADYALTKNLTTLFFYDHAFSEFAISTAFPQTTIRSGFTLRYNFGN
ncbi:cell surface protein SprA [Spongiivirga sp. MCCC 1A20706]|uniref:T9SS outer membrane translocon Sov/SprA n=1 Tax=Spongiivirga sp. MCCC 1A20706 TaxID=3160963 RepID=UPI0039777603